MKRALKFILFFIVVSAVLFTITSYADKQPSVKFNEIDEILYPYTDEVKSYLEANLTKLPRDFVTENTTDNYKDNIISWHFEGDGLQKYIFEISAAGDFTDSKKTELSKDVTEYTLCNLLKAQSYRVRITAVTETGSVSDTASFETTAMGPRVLSLSGPFRGNFRDMGGYYTKDGNYIPQNLVIRGAAVDNGDAEGGVSISDRGMKFLNDELGIKLEIDLRNSEEQNGRTASEITTAEYVNYQLVQYSAAFNKDQATLYAGVFKCFADRDNYPIFIHCAAGADRTGTTVAILEALLNYDQTDIVKDYELSSFYQVGLRERDNITRILGELEEQPDNERQDLQIGAEMYMKKIGVTDTEIKHIKANLYGWAENEFPFADVNENDYFFNSVFSAKEKNVTKGKGDSLFGVGDNCTRAQSVMFLWKAYGSPVCNSIMPFTDVSEDAYYCEAVRWAYANGITSGTSKTTFSPNKTVTRAEVIIMLWALLEKPDVEADIAFKDVLPDIWYANAIRWGVANNITTGTGNGNFSPDTPCKREQIITFIYNALWRY